MSRSPKPVEERAPRAHAKAIVDHTRQVSKKRDENWATEHLIATTSANAIWTITGALAQYADEHAKRYESPIGSDGVLGDEWEQAVRAVRGLLNGELGGLDGGTMDRILCGCSRWRASMSEREPMPKCPKRSRHKWIEDDTPWSHGGTTLKFGARCAHCGLFRTETKFGAQRNPGQRDLIEYQWPPAGDADV